MIYIGIDVAKDKHDCFITNSDSEVLFKAFTIANNLDGFNDLYQKIESVMDDVTKVKVGLEATGHYSYNLLGSSKGRYGKDTAITFRDAARASIGSNMPAKSLELKHTIKLIQELDSEIDEIENEIKIIMDEINSPILSIPGINYRMGAMIIAEIGDFNRFDSPDKILAYAGFSPSTYQSGQLDGAYAHMEKRGSRYLRYALYNATKYVCHWDPTFAAYLAKKRAEGKHYNVAISHAVKKLVRVIYHLEKTKQQYIKVA